MNANQNDPWGETPNNKPDRGSRQNNQSGPPDLEELLRDYWKKLSSGRKSNRNDSSENQGSAKQPPFLRLLAVFAVIAAIVWGIAGFYVLDEQERAVVLRLGKYHTNLDQGLQWQPYFLDKVITVNVTSVRDRFFDNTMLTKDENIVDVQLQVQYIVNDPKLFILSVRDPENALSLATDSALRNIVGSTILDDVITTGRQVVADKVQITIQSYLDVYRSGLRVSKVNVSVAKAPDEVKPAFDDVIKAREDKVRLVNEATAYENAVVPVARGKAERLHEDAQGYKESVIARSKGDTERFLKLLNEYKKAPDVTRRRMYLSTMEKVLSNTSKVLLDVKDSNSLMYLPVDKLLQNSASTPLGNSNTVRDNSGSVSQSVGVGLPASSRTTRETR